MKVLQVNKQVRAEHGVVASFPREFFGYFGWPTVALTQGGRLVVAASGLRNDHVCPFGRTVLCSSRDNGQNWTSPRVINDTPLDDRDAGVVSLGGEKLLLSWFSTDNRQTSGQRYTTMDDKERVARWREGFARMDGAQATRYIGAWIRTSDDGGDNWGEPRRVTLTAPHGPILLQTGIVLFLGKSFSTMENFVRGEGAVASMRSSDGGVHWELGGSVPLLGGTIDAQYHEAHVVELPDGHLIGLIRFQDAPGHAATDIGTSSFSLLQTRSDDRGRTWSKPVPLKFHGAPPHLLYHSSGILVCSYGYRQAPYGQRAMLSSDAGQTWHYDYILRDDGVDSDLGYPSSVELGDGSLFSVYYQKERGAHDRCSLLWTRWWLP